MKTNTRPSRRTVVLATAASIATSLMNTPSSAQTTVQAAAKTKQVAKGTFTVKMTPSAESGFGDTGANLGRMTLDKVFEGDLVAIGKGEMLTALTMTKGSAGYVAIERVTGTLHGKTGSFDPARQAAWAALRSCLSPSARPKRLTAQVRLARTLGGTNQHVESSIISCQQPGAGVCVCH